jgi:hypothetical protein
MQFDPTTVESLHRQRRQAFDGEVDRILRARSATRGIAAMAPATASGAQREHFRLRAGLRRAVAMLIALASPA